MEIDIECSRCYEKAEYNFQDEAYCKGCFCDVLHEYEEAISDKSEVDFIVITALLEEEDYLCEEAVERINNKYDLDIKRLEDINE